jgi:hypothetical protein
MVDDLRAPPNQYDGVGELKEIRGADWNLEIGTIRQS